MTEDNIEEWLHTRLTTLQLLLCPPQAYFYAGLNGRYARELSDSLGRTDIQIVKSITQLDARGTAKVIYDHHLLTGIIRHNIHSCLANDIGELGEKLRETEKEDPETHQNRVGIETEAHPYKNNKIVWKGFDMAGFTSTKAIDPAAFGLGTVTTHL
ncbi:MAG: hypothetical protein Tp152SUR00d2C52646391_74 [Prokaryotic dsDNA virus sp.]|nr:MAG: hypothetical protein Tp152SUR00d2C52646391_74 [Prokaryotic dsDNA virus sp.]